MSERTVHAVQFVAKEEAKLVAIEPDQAPLGEDEIEGRTVVSLISAGTEVVGVYCGGRHGITPASYPMFTGYAAVLEVEAVGASVRSIKPGDLVFAEGGHRSYQRVSEGAAVRVPDGLTPETAVFARMVKIPMPTFVHTRVRPPEKVVVTGLGVVGLMAAQLAGIYGYEVTACEPDRSRRRLAQEHGLHNVLPGVPVSDSMYKGQVGLGIECSGYEQAALDLCDVVRVRGEVFLVGVPWVPRTDLLAQKLLYSVFNNYVGLHSGWEGKMPENPQIHNPLHHFRAALEWLAAGKIRVRESLYKKVSPADPQAVYHDILHRRLGALTGVFDWRQL